MVPKAPRSEPEHRASRQTGAPRIEADRRRPVGEDAAHADVARKHVDDAQHVAFARHRGADRAVIETLVARREIAGALERPGDDVEPRGASRARRARSHDATFAVEIENAGKRGAPDVDSGRFVTPQSPGSRGK